MQTIGGLLNFPENGKEKILEHAVVAVGRLVAARAKRLQAAPGPAAQGNPLNRGDFLAPPGASSMDRLRPRTTAPSNCRACVALAGAAIPAAFASIRIPLAMVDLQWRVQAANAPFARLLVGLA